MSSTHAMNQYVIADPKRCIGCNTCMASCSQAHKTEGLQAAPRLQVMRNRQDSAPVMCRQCEDAPCANVCPNGAIARMDDHIQVVQERCIGCKTCVVACPYGAMEVVTRPVLRQNGAAMPATADKAEAHKCDLCHARAEGPACIEVCPTNALFTLDRNQLQEMSAEKRRRAALDNSSPLLF